MFSSEALMKMGLQPIIPSNAGLYGTNSAGSLEDRLLSRDLFQDIKRNTKRTIMFLCSHIDELVFLAFSDISNPLSQISFGVLISPNPRITKAACDSDFFKTSVECLLSESADPQFLKRLSIFASLSINNFPEQFSTSFSYIMSMVPLCGCQSVLQMFRAILENSPSLRQIHTCLLSEKFVPKLIEILQMQMQILSSSNEDLCENLFALLSDAAQNEDLCFDCFSESSIVLSKKYLMHSHLKVLSAQWGFILQILCEENATQFEAIIATAIRGISQRFGGFIQFQVFELEFLISMASTKAESLSSIDILSMISSVANIFSEFKFHSIALDACVRFAIACMSKKEISNIALNSFLPIICNSIENQDNIIHFSFCFDLSIRIRDLTLKSAEFRDSVLKSDEFIGLLNGVIAEKEEILLRH